MTFLNGGPAQKLTPAFSFSIACETQEEIDHYWAKLGNGGKELGCGWIEDKFGLCWQVVPTGINELVSTPAGMKAMMAMTKFDIAALKAAAAK
jgi:predicted 3-demethylubiquinone-9 3-methyltransferase (glyoxalase superfamily)